MRTALFLPLLLVLSACQAQSGADDTATEAADHSGMDHGSMDHSQTPGDTAYSDVHFLDHMTMHHQMAIDMARLVEDRGESPTVRRMTEDFIRAQTIEIDSMRAWRLRWFADEPTPAPLSPAEVAMMGMAMDMEPMRTATGRELDRQFLMGMIPHHAGAITMAAHAQMRSERPEIRDLAQTIIAAQAREIGEMQAMTEAMGLAARGDNTGR